MFTDDDLNRLKRDEMNLNTEIHESDCNLILALIARLEAAEMCCQFMWISEHPIDDSATDAYKAWRKAAGK